MLEPQTYPFTRYYLRVPGEHEGSWVPLHIGLSAIPQTWSTQQEAMDYAMFNACLLHFRVIEVTEREVWASLPSEGVWSLLRRNPPELGETR